MVLKFFFQVFPLSLIVLTALHVDVTASYPILRSLRSHIIKGSSSSENSYGDLPAEFIAYNYTQTLDHFNYQPESYATFNQKYIINFKHWGGANASSPIFVYTGEESPVAGDIPYAGFIVDLASRFKGLLLYIEVSMCFIL